MAIAAKMRMVMISRSRSGHIRHLAWLVGPLYCSGIVGRQSDRLHRARTSCAAISTASFYNSALRLVMGRAQSTHQTPRQRRS